MSSKPFFRIILTHESALIYGYPSIYIFPETCYFLGMISETVNSCHGLCLFITPENCVSLQDSVSSSTNLTSGQTTSKNLTSAAAEFWE